VPVVGPILGMFRSASLSLRSTALMGKAFRLRDRGQLDQAMSACRRALDLALDPRVGDDSDVAFGTLIIGALTMDEIACRLGQPTLAQEPLEHALHRIESSKRKSVTPLRSIQDGDLVRQQELRIRKRLDEIRAHR
jgi:hypothetical protein